MRRSGASLRCVAPVSYGFGVQSPGGFARGGTVFRGLQPSEARLRRAKRGSAERSEAPPSEAKPSRRAKRGRPAERSEAVPPSEARTARQGIHLLLSFLFYRGCLIKILFSKKINSPRSFFGLFTGPFDVSSEFCALSSVEYF